MTGTEWVSADRVDHKTLRQKTRTIASANYLDQITDAYPGQQIMSTTTNANRIQEKHYYRMSANQTWSPSNLTESAELLLFAGNFPGQIGQHLSGLKTYTAESGTLPSSPYLFYLITAIEWQDEVTHSDYVYCGVDFVDTWPITQSSTVLAAIGREEQIDGSSRHMHKNTHIVSRPIRAGSLIASWVYTTGGNDVPMGQASTNQYKSTLNQTFADNSALGGGTTGCASLNIYGRGYK